MKPENILQADLLDIIFINRNKDYGAYALRKYYDSRLLKSFAITFLLAAIFVVGRYIKSYFFKEEVKTFSAAFVKDVELEKHVEIKKPEQAIKEIKRAPKPLAEKAYTEPKIVEDVKADKPLAAIDDLVNKVISNHDKDGEATAEDEVMIAPAEQGETNMGEQAAPIEPVEMELPLVKAEVMPEFPGGMEAFKKFMHRNLRQPDLEEGEKVVVRVRFVVDADGSINQVNVVKSGGTLDNEVLRVVGKMPKWKPGFQNGKHVAVYFTLPVTFLGPES